MADEREQQEVLARIDDLAIAVHRGFERVDARITGLETEVRSGLAEVRSGLAEVRGSLDTLTIEMREVKADVRGLNARVTVIESKVDL
jgi:septation ring formation regulator EzrA